MVTGTHALARSHFDELASGLGDIDAITALRAGQHSKHILQLRALLGVAEQLKLRHVLEPGFALLCATQKTAPGAVAELLMHPPVGGWLAHCLRRLRGSTDGGGPVEGDLGHLSALAAVAAIRADMDFDISVPSRAGTVMLPMLGMATIPSLAPGESVRISRSAGRSATVRGADGRVVIPPDCKSNAAGWMSLHRIEVGQADRRLCVYLDDLDPFRDCHGMATTGRLDAEPMRRWRALLDEAWSLLTRVHPAYARSICAGLQSIVPLRCRRPGHGTTATSTDSFGACVMSEPTNAVTLAVGLVHEFQHAKLGALMDLLQLHSDDRDARHYAPWRDDPRPLGGLLQGAYAFFAVTDFWRAQRAVMSAEEAQFAHFEFARWREQTLNAVATLQSSGQLTDLGAQLVASIGDQLSRWAVQVPPESAAAAQDAIADHRTTWRLRNLRAQEGTVRRIVAAWQAGQPCPSEAERSPEIRIGDAAVNDHGRLDLLFLRLQEPDRFAMVDSGSGELAAVVPAADDADVAYVRGDLEGAAEGYRHTLRTQPDRLAAWAGLALIRKRLAAGRDDPLVNEPEKVMAVYQSISAITEVPPDPYELADWLVSGSPARFTGTAVRCRTAGGADS